MILPRHRTQAHPGWSLLEHPAEAGLRVRGRTLRELFTHAARGMTAILTGGAVVSGPQRRMRVRAQAATQEELLVAWLRELLFQFERYHFIARRWRFTRLDERRLVAEVRGVCCDPRRQRLGAEIKAVTYHQLRLIRRRGVYHAQLIFDV